MNVGACPQVLCSPWHGDLLKVNNSGSIMFLELDRFKVGKVRIARTSGRELPESALYVSRDVTGVPEAFVSGSVGMIRKTGTARPFSSESSLREQGGTLQVQPPKLHPQPRFLLLHL